MQGIPESGDSPSDFGVEVWLSLVERCVRDAEVVSSNLATSTRTKKRARLAPFFHVTQRGRSSWPDGVTATADQETRLSLTLRSRSELTTAVTAQLICCGDAGDCAVLTPYAAVYLGRAYPGLDEPGMDEAELSFVVRPTVKKPLEFVVRLTLTVRAESFNIPFRLIV